MSCCDSLNCGIDKSVNVRLGRSCGRNGRQGATAHGVLIAGAEQDFSLNVCSPGLGQAPGAGNALRDVCRLYTCCTGELAQTCGHSLGKDNAEWGVARSCSLDALTQGSHVSISSTINSWYADFCGHIHEQLVTAGRNTIGELFNRIGVIDLVLADLVLECEQNHNRLSCAKWQVRSVSRSSTASWSSGRCRCGSNGLCLSRRNRLSVVRGSRCRRLSGIPAETSRRGGRGCFAFFSIEGLSWCFFHVLQHDLILVALNVEYWQVNARDVHGTLSQVGQGRRCRETNFNDLVYFIKEQFLGFNPAHW